MITTSSDFKTALKTTGRQIYAYLNDNGTYIRGDDDLQSLKVSASGDIGKAIMKMGEVTYTGNHTYLGKKVNLGYGVVLSDTSIEYVDFGEFTVISEEYNKALLNTKIKMYDDMYDSLQLYDLVDEVDINYPATLKELLEAVCIRLHWTLLTSTFPNSTLSIATELFTEQKLTFRDVLDDIAEASGSVILFNNSNELEVRQIAKTGVVETLDKDTLNTLELQARYGEINSVVLAREPQGDYIASVQ